MKGLGFFCLLIAWGSPAFGRGGPEAASHDGLEAIAPRERIRLFNGTNLAGFHSWLVDTKEADPRRVFSLTNGMLRISGEGLGYLSTDRAFENYRLVAEFKWGNKNWRWGDRIGKARDSGIFLHSAGPEGNSDDGHGAFKAAIECNIFQGATGDLLLIRGHEARGQPIAPRLRAQVAPERDADGWFFWAAGGRWQTIERWGRLNWFDKDRHWKDQLDFRGPHDLEKASPAWNRLECLCRRDQIQIFLNGRLVNEAHLVWPRSGKILFQCEGSEIFFRRIELAPAD